MSRITESALKPSCCQQSESCLAASSAASPEVAHSPAGECATSGLAALLAAKQDSDCWQQLGFNADSVILLIGSEGATDADIYAEFISTGRA